MKIAVLSHLHYPIAEPFAGGLEMHTHMLVSELVERGHDVTLYAKAGSDTKARLFTVVSEGFTFRSYALRPLVELQEWRMHLAEFMAMLHMKTQNYDVVINNSLSPLPYTRLQTTPMITILHTPATLERVNKIIEKPAWQPSPFHKFVSVSASNSIGWKRLLPEVSVVPNGIRLSDWQGNVTSRPGLAVWSGRITREKGLHIAIQAAKLAKMNLKIAGPIHNEKYFRRCIRPQLDESIEYVGHIPHRELARFYATGQVAISSPIWEEPFGLSTIEALATGTPIAALPHGAMKSLVTPEVGAISRDDSPAALARAIIKAKKIKRSACQKYAQNFAIEAMVDGYETIINDIEKPVKTSRAWKNG